MGIRSVTKRDMIWTTAGFAAGCVLLWGTKWLIW